MLEKEPHVLWIGQVMPNIKPFALVFNSQGMDQKSGIFYIQPSAALLIQNMHRDTTGVYSAHNQGYTNWSPQLESGVKIDSLGTWRDVSGNDYIFADVNGKIYSLDSITGASNGTIATTLTAGNKAYFSGFQGNLYMTEKSIEPMKWTGSGSMSAISLFPFTNGSEIYDKPALITAFDNRIAYANFNGSTLYPSHILLSDTLNAESCTIATTNDTDGFIAQIAPGDGQTITAMRPLYIPSLNIQNLIVYKDFSTYAVVGTTPTTFKVVHVNDMVGALNPNCVVQFGSDHIVLDRNTIYSLSTANQAGSIIPRDLGSLLVKTTLASLNFSAKDKAWACHLPFRREIWFGIPTGSNTEVDTILVYYYEDPQQPGSWSVRTGTNQSCPLMVNTENIFLTGDYSGYVNKWFTSSQYGTTGYTFEYQYPWFDFGAKSQIKRVKELYAWFLNAAPQQTYFTSEWRRGGNNIVRSQTIDVGQNTIATYGSAVFGVDVYGDTPLVVAKLPIPGNGEQFRFTISGQTTLDGPEFLGLTGLVEYGGPVKSYR